MASLTFLNKSSFSCLISILLWVWCVNLTQIVAWAEGPWPCLSQLLLLLGYFWAGKVRWMSLIQVSFVCLRAMSCSCAAGVCFTGEKRQKLPLQSFPWGCNTGAEWGVIFTSLLLYYFAYYCRSCQPLIPFPGKRFSVWPSLLDLTRCSFSCSPGFRRGKRSPTENLRGITWMVFWRHHRTNVCDRESSLYVQCFSKYPGRKHASLTGDIHGSIERWKNE